MIHNYQYNISHYLSVTLSPTPPTHLSYYTIHLLPTPFSIHNWYYLPHPVLTTLTTYVSYLLPLQLPTSPTIHHSHYQPLPLFTTLLPRIYTVLNSYPIIPLFTNLTTHNSHQQQFSHTPHYILIKTITPPYKPNTTHYTQSTSILYLNLIMSLNPPHHFYHATYPFNQPYPLLSS